MTKRIFRSIFIVALTVFFASLIVIMGMLYSYFSDMQMEQLTNQTALAARGVEENGIQYFNDLELKDYRITWIAPDGTVKYDTDASADKMENHLEREEIKKAMEKGNGTSVRYSTTLTERCLYSAKRLSDGSVIRLSGSHYTVLNLILNMVQPIVIVIFIAVALSLALAFRLSKRIVKPLNEMDLDHPQAAGEGYEELSPLLERIASQQSELKSQSVKLRQKKDEFEAAANNMSEGLILLNEKGRILSINRFASKLFGISDYCLGRDMLIFNNSYEFQELLRKAQQGEHAETTIPLCGCDYQINASPVVSNGKVSGVALLIFDITEKEKSEQMRREFTANVSHELKTPLHTILGCAELMSNGVVKEADMKSFADRVYSETERMIALVDDIIRLSHLDEGANDMKREKVDLYELADRTVRSLAPSAQAADIKLKLSGEKAEMSGIPQLLSGIIFNLCDNAIKYNECGGCVDVKVTDAPEVVTLTVSDDGIGIPDEQQDRIFERFYRVDKSHSKEVGGTGLGLSIVKHAAILHNASIELNSVLNKGTTITLKFPKQ